jgi:hypothetical protein
MDKKAAAILDYFGGTGGFLLATVFRIKMCS